MRLINLSLILLFYMLFICLPVHSINSLSLYINSAEGGEISKRRLQQFKNHLNKNGCEIQNIYTTEQFARNEDSDFIFNPLADDDTLNYAELAKVDVLNNEALSMSILLRDQQELVI